MAGRDPRLPAHSGGVMGTDIEVVLPNESPTMPAHALIELAGQAQRLGYRTAWLPDHLLPPADYGHTYGGVYEPLLTLAHLAAGTSTLRLGTSVLVLPMRNPFVLAKQVATLARLSGDRVNLGVGVGWDPVEFANVGADFADRGTRTDEAVTLLRQLFTGADSFDGEYYKFSKGVFQPLPQHPIPITVGGVSDRALTRAADLADAWQGVGLSPEAFSARLARLRELTDRPIRVSSRVAWAEDTTCLGDTVTQARGLAEAGADAVAVWFGDYRVAGERMTRFADAWHHQR